MTKILLITGCNGFIGSNVAASALQLGYEVRAVVRSDAAAAKLQNMLHTSDRLSITTIRDFTQPDAYRHVLNGVGEVVHAASPFNFKPKHNERDLLKPAIGGSISILNAIKLHGSLVRRLVVVSSFAAVVHFFGGLRPGYIYTADDWNPMSYTEACVTNHGMAAYCASKGLAEQAMWDWMARNKTEISFTLTAINPPWVFGPYIDLSDLNYLCESVNAVRNLLDAGHVPPPDIPAFADVRDVTLAIIRALEREEAGGYRFIIGSRFEWQTACDIIRKNFPELWGRVPEGFQGTGSELACYTLDSGPAKRILGVDLTSLETSLTDTVSQLLQVEIGSIYKR